MNATLKPIVHATVIALGLSSAGMAREPDQVVVYKKTKQAELKLHIFQPPGHQPSEKRPAIVFFFGGGWNSGKPGQFFPHCEYLASRGMVAASAEYRVKSAHGTTPRECVMDGKSAVRWLRQHAGELGIDPQRIAAGGGSAGGHVAAATAIPDHFEEPDEDKGVSCRPDALVLYNPVFDNGPGGYGHDRVKEYWKEISPMHHIGKNTPPTVVFLGTKDHLIPVTTAEKYRRLMEENGRRCDLHLYEDQKHGFFNQTNRKYYLKTLLETDRFL
ncbi:MAG TPA: alpha/beta hydrolase, partial [Luteolibacter sp.]|nr:alpha/beta hydrolase [Luteolibacter sp.]